MRQAREATQWSTLQARAGSEARAVQIDGLPLIDVSVPCTIVGGKNGAGKSRLLRAVAGALEQSSVLIDLHHLAEQALMILRSREDFDEMAEEFGTIGPDERRLEDVRRVIGREYERVEWFSLEVEPSNEKVANRFCWAGDQPLLPYFRVVYRGGPYSSREMGLGEFSVHFMFWILEQYRDQQNLVVLLDEPDAYLPPIGVSALLSRLLRVCDERSWSMIISTHSEELIKQAVEHEAFLYVQAADDGDFVGTRSADDSRVADTLLARPAIQVVLFCEDETAYWLTRSILGRIDRLQSTTIVWGGGDGYMRKLHSALPRSPRPDIAFGYVFDGDQRDDLPAAGAGRWPAVALPTSEDPDALLKGLRREVPKVAAKLGESLDVIARRLDSLEGQDPHDWLNGLGESFGRAKVLGALADLWCDENPAFVEEFARSFAVIGVR